jgi:hypothetical protein
VTDVYVYYFMRYGGPDGEKILSKRRATIEAITGKGDEVDMESQIVVDHTEVDENGFLVGGVGNGSHPMDELWAQIRSLERRANSRDGEALTLNESGEGQRIYLLRLESRELRSQAQRLKKSVPIRWPAPGSALFLKSATPSTAIPIDEVGNHKGSNYQSDRTNPPAHAHTPIQTSATTKQQ